MPTDSTVHRCCSSFSSCLWLVTINARLVMLLGCCRFVVESGPDKRHPSLELIAVGPLP